MPAQLKRRLAIFFTLVAIIALAFLAHWYFKGRFYESTDNAYVQGEITRISSQLGARIDAVPVEDNQHVNKGDLLVRLEAADFDLAVDRARATLATREAEYAQAQSRLTQQGSLIAAGQAQVAANQATFDRSRVDLSRAESCASQVSYPRNGSQPCRQTAMLPALRSTRPAPTCKASASR